MQLISNYKVISLWAQKSNTWDSQKLEIEISSIYKRNYVSEAKNAEQCKVKVSLQAMEVSRKYTCQQRSAFD